MKAFELARYGKQARLALVDRPPPVLRDDEVLVRVHAAGLNPLDCRIRDGDFKLILPYRLPLVLGHDVAGVVVQLGAKLQQPGQAGQAQPVQLGDEVWARLDDFRIGSLAEFVAVKASSLAPKPRNLSMEAAASVPLAALTAWQALVERAQLQPGQKVFIQAGSGGVGSLAIQLAKHLGAQVATTTGTANVDFVKALGADQVIDYKTQDFAEVLRDMDLVLNSQDTATLFKSLGVLRPGGRVISISGPPDPAFAQAVGAPAFLKLALRALSWRVRRRARQGGLDYSSLFMRADGGQLRDIGALFEAGTLRPVLDQVFPFDATHEAMARVDSGRARGKVVVKLV